MIPARAMRAATTGTQDGILRLENWSRWCNRGEISEIMVHFYPRKAAICGEYRPESGDIWGNEPVEMPVDEKDAIEVERLVLAMPIQLKKAVMCFYLARPRFIGVPEKVLREWVDQAARRLSDIGFER